MKYQDLLKHPKWQKKRLEILSRDGFKCQKCKDGETTLHVHHEIYSNGKKPWEYDNKNLTTLCSDCHDTISWHHELVKNENILPDKKEESDKYIITKNHFPKSGLMFIVLYSIVTDNFFLYYYGSKKERVSAFYINNEMINMLKAFMNDVEKSKLRKGV